MLTLGIASADVGAWNNERSTFFHVSASPRSMWNCQKKKGPTRA